MRMVGQVFISDGHVPRTMALPPCITYTTAKKILTPRNVGIPGRPLLSAMNCAKDTLFFLNPNRKYLDNMFQLRAIKRVKKYLNDERLAKAREAKANKCELNL